MRGFLIAALLFVFTFASGQTVCTNPGQTPGTAFPVCGISTFKQASVPLCGGRRMPFKNCGGDLLTGINPYWYKFTCFQSGTLGFLITPLIHDEDYDWELYDITNRNPDDVFTDGSLVISNNWSGEFGNTGASSAGNQLFVCGGGGKPLFSQRPNLIAGHNYLLLVSHFTSSQSGYNLSFGGGTAVITDPTEPHLQKADASCSGDVVTVRLNKSIKCSSLAANGTEFYLSPGTIPVQAAVGINRSTQFDTDSLQLQLASPLAPGTYTLHIKKSSDGNTLLDYCDRQIAETETLSVTILPKAPTPMDSIGTLQCSPNQLRVYFSKPMLCSSIAANGSDFAVAGTYPVSVTAAAGVCTGGATKEILITLSQPLQVAGNFQLLLQQGADGNTVLNECTEQTPAGSALSFSVMDTVSATFTYNIAYDCLEDKVFFTHSGDNSVNVWQWKMDDNQASTAQNPTGVYTTFTQKTIQLFVSNGFCTDSSTQTLLLDNFLQAGFTSFEDICPNEPVAFTGSGQGRIVSYAWDFGDGGAASTRDATHVYRGPDRQTPFVVRYIVNDSFGCSDTASTTITVYSSCYLALPNAFTPNGDGKNDLFKVMNAIKAENLEFLVFNRWGQQMFKTADWKKGWDGKFAGQPQPSAVYVWYLQSLMVIRDTKQKVEQKGTVMLIR